MRFSGAVSGALGSGGWNTAARWAHGVTSHSSISFGLATRRRDSRILAPPPTPLGVVFQNQMSLHHICQPSAEQEGGVIGGWLQEGWVLLRLRPSRGGRRFGAVGENQRGRGVSRECCWQSYYIVDSVSHCHTLTHTHAYTNGWQGLDTNAHVNRSHTQYAVWYKLTAAALALWGVLRANTKDGLCDFLMADTSKDPALKYGIVAFPR